MLPSQMRFDLMRGRSAPVPGCPLSTKLEPGASEIVSALIGLRVVILPPGMANGRLHPATHTRLRFSMIYDVNSALFRSFLGSGGASHAPAPK